MSQTIADEDLLFAWLHKSGYNPKKDAPHSGAFKFSDDGKSCFWGKKISIQQARKLAPKPSDNGMLEFVTRDVRSLEGMDAIHTPDYGPAKWGKWRDAHASITRSTTVSKSEAITHLKDIGTIRIRGPCKP